METPVRSLPLAVLGKKERPILREVSIDLFMGAFANLRYIMLEVLKVWPRYLAWAVVLKTRSVLGVSSLSILDLTRRRLRDLLCRANEVDFSKLTWLPRHLSKNIVVCCALISSARE